MLNESFSRGGGLAGSAWPDAVMAALLGTWKSSRSCSPMPSGCARLQGFGNSTPPGLRARRLSTTRNVVRVGRRFCLSRQGTARAFPDRRHACSPAEARFLRHHRLHGRGAQLWHLAAHWAAPSQAEPKSIGICEESKSSVGHHPQKHQGEDVVRRGFTHAPGPAGSVPADWEPPPVTLQPVRPRVPLCWADPGVPRQMAQRAWPLRRPRLGGTTPPRLVERRSSAGVARCWLEKPLGEAQIPSGTSRCPRGGQGVLISETAWQPHFC